VRRLAEIAAGGHFDAPGAAAEIDGVEVELEDRILAQRGLEARRHDHFADLAFVTHFVAHQQVLDDLLRDGRATLQPARLGEVADERADQAVFVDALVLIEALVLGSDECAAHVLRDFGEPHPYTALVLFEHLGEGLALAVEHDARARQLEVPELVVVR
jgi:hypothetical protein